MRSPMRLGVLHNLAPLPFYLGTQAAEANKFPIHLHRGISTLLPLPNL